MFEKEKLTKRERYNLQFFYPKYLDEASAIALVQQISQLGSKAGFIGNQGDDSRREHKYDTWIAKVVKDHLQSLQKANKKLNTNILDRELEFQSIIDWMIAEKIDAFKYTFDEANRAQENWHQKIASEMRIDLLKDIPIDPARVIYRCKDQEYFFYILEPKDLNYEGTHMGHCVGALGYQNKIKNDKSIIISLRDKKNKPHVTTEIVLQKEGGIKLRGIVSQCQGKNHAGGTKPKPEYLEKIQEFVLFASDYYNDETLRFMNKQYF